MQLAEEEKAKFDPFELPKPSRYSEFSYSRDRVARHRPSIQELSPPQPVHILRDSKVGFSAAVAALLIGVLWIQSACLNGVWSAYMTEWLAVCVAEW